MKLINSQKYSERFNELYDWVDDDTVAVLNDYEENNYDIVDYDALERGETPVVEIDEDGIDGILVDNIDEPQMMDKIIEEPEEIPT
jgi:hypothetical protein